MTPRSVPLFVAVMTGGLALSTWLMRRQSDGPLGLDARQRAALWVGAFGGGVMGARLLFLWITLAGGGPAPALWDGGKTIVGGLAGGYLGVEAVKWAMGLKVKTGDSLCVPVAVGVAVGRVGCWIGRCCYGTPTTLPWGVDFGDGVRRHPTQLYELAFHSLMALLLWRLKRSGAFKLQLMKLYILSYLVYRFLTEFIRPELRLAAGLTGYQWACLALIPVFAALWALDARAA